MSKAIRVKYEKGVLKPLEPLEFEEGEELIVEVRRSRSGRGIDRFFGVIKARKAETFIREEDYYEYLSDRGLVS